MRATESPVAAGTEVLTTPLQYCNQLKKGIPLNTLIPDPKLSAAHRGNSLDAEWYDCARHNTETTVRAVLQVFQNSCAKVKRAWNRQLAKE